jgi:hypothetical protein
MTLKGRAHLQDVDIDEIVILIETLRELCGLCGVDKSGPGQDQLRYF